MAETILEYTYAGDPTFAVNFNLGYIDRSHVQVRVNLAVDGAGDPVYANFVWVDAANITITDPLVNGDEIAIIRTVPKDSLAVEFSEGDDITPENLDKQALQGLMTYEELLDGRVGESSPKLDADRAELARDEAEVANVAAQQAKDDAEAAETNAQASETASAGSASAAATSETNAAASETNAAASAAAALASENAAAISESNAATSEANAATSETNAAASEADVAIKYADFDTKYLGYKASDPTLDNQGDPLVHGQLYYNTTSDQMLAYVKDHATEPDGWYWIGTDPALSVLAASVTFDASNNDTNVTNLQTLLQGILDGSELDDGAIAPAKLDRTYAVPADIPYFAEYHDASNVASWKITGDTLECWGFVNTAANGTAVVTFPKTFAYQPIISATCLQAANASRVQVTAQTPASANFFGTVGGLAAVTTVLWRAVGKWDGIS